MKQSTAVITSDSWLCHGSLGCPGMLPACWKLLGKLPEVRTVAQVEAAMAVRLQIVEENLEALDVSAMTLRASKLSSAGLGTCKFLVFW